MHNSDIILALKAAIGESDGARANDLANAHRTALLTTLDGAFNYSRAKELVCEKEDEYIAHQVILGFAPGDIRSAYRTAIFHWKRGEKEEARRRLLRLEIRDGVSPILLVFVCAFAHELELFDLARSLFAAIKDNAKIEGAEHAKVHSMYRLLRGIYASEYGNRSTQVNLPAHTKLLFIDPGFNYAAGHHYQFMLYSQKHLAPALGIEADEVTCLFSRGARKPEGVDSFPFENSYAALDYKLYLADQIVGIKLTPPLLLHLSEAYERAIIGAVGTSLPDSLSTLFIPTAVAYGFAGLAKWSASIEGGLKRKLVMGFFQAEFTAFAPDEREACEDALRTGIKIINEAPYLEPLYITETEEVMRTLVSLGVRPANIILVPYMAASMVGKPRAQIAMSNPKMIVGLAGGVRPEKGYHMMIPAFEEFGGRDDLEWWVHASLKQCASAPKVDEQSLDQQLDRLSGEGKVNWAKTNMSDESYSAFMRSLDVVVLPYDPSRYKAAGSGIFFEAIILQKLLLVVDGTFMPAALDQIDYPYVLIKKWSPAGVRDAMAYLLENRKALHQKLVEWRQSGKTLDTISKVVNRLKA